MSLRGFNKRVVRAPTVIKRKIQKNELFEDDPVFVDSERRFNELETATKRFGEESKKYFKAVNGLLDHQIEFSEGIKQIYKPISGKVSDPNHSVPEDSPEGLDACVAYRELVEEMKSTLGPDLLLIEEKIITPTKELLEIINAVRKMMTKRTRKKIDLDKATDNVHKLEAKDKKTSKDEEKLYKYQEEYEVVKQEYDYYNDICLGELPQLFHLEGEFIKPLFVSFYFMQLSIFYTLFSGMEQLKIPYFDLETDIMTRFQEKRGNVEELADSLGICQFKSSFAKTKLELTRNKYSKDVSQNDETTSFGGPLGAYSRSSSISTAPTTNSTTSFHSLYVKSPTIQTENTCVALYDYTAQTEGDLSFKAGSIIEIVQKTESQNGWWTGICNGRQGIFPGNYVELSK